MPDTKLGPNERVMAEDIVDMCMDDEDFCREKIYELMTLRMRGKLTAFTCDCGRIFLVEGHVIGKEF